MAGDAKELWEKYYILTMEMQKFLNRENIDEFLNIAEQRNVIFDRMQAAITPKDKETEEYKAFLAKLQPIAKDVLNRSKVWLARSKQRNVKVRSYTAYINNTRTPWRRFTGGFGSDRRALLISDSFGNAFLPYLLPYYGEVHMTDLRLSYYDVKEAGGTFRDLLALHEIDDVYIVLSTSNGVNSPNSQGALPKAILAE